jgi:hypothetical protein
MLVPALAYFLTSLQPSRALLLTPLVSALQFDSINRALPSIRCSDGSPQSISHTAKCIPEARGARQRGGSTLSPCNIEVIDLSMRLTYVQYINYRATSPISAPSPTQTPQNATPLTPNRPPISRPARIARAQTSAPGTTSRVAQPIPGPGGTCPPAACSMQPRPRTSRRSRSLGGSELAALAGGSEGMAPEPRAG